MGGHLRPEEIVTMEVLQEKGVAKRAIARTLEMTEGAVRYRLRGRAVGAVPGRREKPFKATKSWPPRCSTGCFTAATCSASAAAVIGCATSRPGSSDDA